MVKLTHTHTRAKLKGHVLEVDHHDLYSLILKLHNIIMDNRYIICDVFLYTYFFNRSKSLSTLSLILLRITCTCIHNKLKVHVNVHAVSDKIRVCYFFTIVSLLACDGET